MTRRRLPWNVWALFGTGTLSLACAALNFDEPRPTLLAEGPASATASPDGTATEAPEPSGAASNAREAIDSAAETGETVASDGSASAGAGEKMRRTTPTRARLEQRKNAPAPEAPKDWRVLTREARDHVQDGRYDRATELLEQAALQLKERKPTSTPRRTVFGLRARHALLLARRDQTEKADELADRLFDEVRSEPALADSALVDLARATAERRRLAAKEAGRTESQLPLLALALDAAETGTASRDRLGLAFQVSNLAVRAERPELARRAIERAIRDARIVAPNDRIQTGALEIYKARIAIAEGDLETAEASANAAKRIFEETEASASNRGIAEATLAQVLGEKGANERALELARTAYARLSADEKIADHARRQIVAALARVERLAGDAEAAGSHYREALSVPDDGSDLDAYLIHAVKSAIAELEAPSAASRASDS